MRRSVVSAPLFLAVAITVFETLPRARATAADCLPPDLFQPPTSSPTGPSPRRQALADFNQDGILDLAIATSDFEALNLSSGVQIRLGQGTAGDGFGTFDPPTTYSAGSHCTAVAVADFNQDQIADLAVANFGSDNVSILLGQGLGGIGSGFFGPPSQFAAGPDPHHLRTGDFDEDGHVDIAVANNGVASVSILLGDGNGGLAAPVSYPIADRSVGIASGDFNEDGILDLVASCNFAQSVAVLLGNGSAGQGDGTFAPAVHYPAGAEPYDLAVADFDEDGITDLAVANTTGGGIAILRGNGGGGIGNGTFGAPAIYVAGRNAPSVVAFDANQDGVLDLAYTHTNPPQVALLLGNGAGGIGDGTFSAGLDYAVGLNPAGLVSGDFDEDGAPDLAAIAHDQHQSWILLGACVTGPTPTTVSVALAEAQLGLVRIIWAGAWAPGTTATIQRRTLESAWEIIGRASANGSRRIELIDETPKVGTRSGYRLVVSSGSVEEFVGEVWVDVPAYELALDGARPNPAVDGRMSVWFTLPGPGAATLELLDLGGRRLVAHQVGTRGAGRHLVDLGAGRRLAAGVYLVRLTRGSRTLTTKLAFTP